MGREGQAMISPIVKRSIVKAGHKTSVSLENQYWRTLREIAEGRDMTVSDLIVEIDTQRRHGNLSSAIRLFVLDFYRNQISELQKRARTREMLANAAAPIGPKEGH